MKLTLREWFAIYAVDVLERHPKLRHRWNILMCGIAVRCLQATYMSSLIGHQQRRAAFHMVQNLLEAMGVKGARK